MALRTQQCDRNMWRNNLRFLHGTATYVQVHNNSRCRNTDVYPTTTAIDLRTLTGASSSCSTVRWAESFKWVAERKNFNASLSSSNPQKSANQSNCTRQVITRLRTRTWDRKEESSYIHHCTHNMQLKKPPKDKLSFKILFKYAQFYMMGNFGTKIESKSGLHTVKHCRDCW